MSFNIKKGVIYADEGIPESPRWFTDDRMYFEFDEYGVSQVEFRYPNAIGKSTFVGSNTVFLKDLWDGFRCYMENNLHTYKLTFNSSEMWPFGIKSHFDFLDADIIHETYAINESLVFRIQTPSNLPENSMFKLEFYDSFKLTKSPDFRYRIANIRRTWEDWVFEDNKFMTGFTDEEAEKPKIVPSADDNNPAVALDSRDSSTLYTAISADFNISYKRIDDKHILKSPVLEPNKTYSFVISFAETKDELRSNLDNTVKNLDDYISNTYKRYIAVRDNMPEFISPYKSLNDFMSLCPLYHESLKVTRFPGAVRAKTSNYGVWGWDGLTSNYSPLYWGDAEIIKQEFDFYERTADKELGIGHMYRNDMKPASISAIPAQGMYISLLTTYYAMTGDDSVIKERYSFAKKIFDMICSQEVKGTGYCKGTSLFPDFPRIMKETGNDISVFNNTVFYCAARSMEYIAEMMGDTAYAEKARTIFKKIESNFLDMFYDDEKGFIVNSVDASTLEQRDCFCATAIKWETNYCAELVDELMKKSLPFFEEHIIAPAGLRSAPLWDSSYDGDANQFHCWWPVTGEFFMRLINGEDRKDLLEKWEGWVSYWTGMLMIPEGISYMLETDKPEKDRWTSQGGTWQAYTMRGWYQAAIHSMAGVDVECGGLTFYPYSGENMEIKNLHYRGKTLDIKFVGAGKYIESIDVDGKKVCATNKLPVDMLINSHNIITVNRVNENPYDKSIVYGYGADITDYSYENGRIKFNVTGFGTARIKLNYNIIPKVTVNGKELALKCDEKTFELVLNQNKDEIVIM